ncbi:TssN family type VI secretion system protein [Tenacibaculum sp. Bg11-29]|uniref:TssN family type VI secretion system protein n=1 Tax=Tenacibaculum sp. Bg11-29 TaxID=2058306 RepID=UPI0012FED1D2|nr:TssN family type VI secretion system protein [Tenacibaculum sp. Bg11-29]
MNVLLLFFLKYLLAPLVMIVATVVLNTIAKGKAVLKLKKLMIFILLLAVLLILPSLLGFLKYEFIWGGLVISICSYLLLGFLFNWFSTTNFFKDIGFKENKWLMILGLFIAVILASWAYYFVFSWANELGYELWAMLTVLWFLVPPFYVFSRGMYLQIPSPFYKLWIVNNELNDEEYWNSVDTFRLMQVTVKVKRSPEAKEYASFSVKLPEDVSLGRWFNRFIDDQNIRFPNNIIELEDGNGPYGWILYTNKWLPMPIFTRMLDFDGDVIGNKIKNKTVLYVRRVSKNKEDEVKATAE